MVYYIINKIFEPEEFKNLPNKLKSVIAIIHEGEGDALAEVIIKKNNKLVTKSLVHIVREYNMFTITERYYESGNPPKTAIRKHKLGSYIASICSSIAYLNSEFMPFPPNNPNKFAKLGVLNLFPGFKSIPIPKSDYNFDKFVEPWLDHIKIILCKNCEAVFNNVIGFRAYLIQYPHKKYAFENVFKSKKGDIIINELEFFAKYIVGLDLVQRYNKYSAEKCRQNAEARKYFNNLHINVLTEEGARHVIRYLMEYDLESSEFDPYDVPPTTQYLKELEAYSEPPPITFLKEWDWTRLLANGDRSKITLPCKMKDIVHEFLIWIKERTTFVSNHYKTTRGFEITVIRDKYSHLIEKTNRKYQNAYLYTNISLEGEQNLKIDLTGIQH